MNEVKVFIGWDARDTMAWDVCSRSIHRNSSVSFDVLPLLLGDVIKMGFETPSVDACETTRIRHALPLILRGSGVKRAIFVDCWSICTGDLARALDVWDEKVAVQFVPHAPGIGSGAVTFWNLEHLAHQHLTPELINKAPIRELDMFTGYNFEDKAHLPPEWNVRVGIDTMPVNKPMFFNFVNGGPWFEGWPGGSMDWLWNEEAQFLKGKL